jgi:hypothetical protein
MMNMRSHSAAVRNKNAAFIAVLMRRIQTEVREFANKS